MKKSVLELTEQDVIHAETEEQAIALCKLFDNLGLKWKSGESFLEKTEWHYNRENTCYSPAKRGYCSLISSKKHAATIYKATDFISVPEELIEVEIKDCELYPEKEKDLGVVKTYLRAKLIIAEHYKDLHTAEEIVSLIEKYDLI